MVRDALKAETATDVSGIRETIPSTLVVAGSGYAGPNCSVLVTVLRNDAT